MYVLLQKVQQVQMLAVRGLLILDDRTMNLEMVHILQEHTIPTLKSLNMTMMQPLTS
ncbi:Uncharacterised protein [Streptococcus suis]|uniref:Uncharacterized protein n=1 Tax=Streptococcus suis TaxID=1307 RepID=A0A116LUC4_STRSU|nr:Uncharacterised protein [Streptococcus suis]